MELKKLVTGVMTVAVMYPTWHAQAYDNGVNPTYEAPKVHRAPKIDGIASEALCGQRAVA